jgi:hypothetical protein
VSDVVTDEPAPTPVREAGPTSLWDRFFFEPQSTSPAALVRIAWGAISALWALTLLPDVDPFLTDGALRYERRLPPGSWSPLNWTSWDGDALAVCLALLVASLATMVGYRTRLSAVAAALCMITLQRGNSTIFNSGDLVLRQIGIVVALAPAGLVLSLDARRARRRGAWPPPWRAPWALRLLQLELAIGYALSGWAKVRGATWHEGTALGLALRIEDLRRFGPPEWLFEQSILLNALTWFTLLFEVGFLLAVWNRRLRPWVLGIGVAFHLGIDIFLDIGFFSVAMWTAYLAFIPPEVADRLIGRLDAGSSGRASRAGWRWRGDRGAGGDQLR